MLSDALGRARGGRGGLVVIHGPAGIGKSALVAAAKELGSATGMAVLSARGTELERELPYGAALQLFEPRLRVAPAAERARLLAGAAALAAPLFRGARGAEHGANHAFSLIHGLHWLAANLSEAAPCSSSSTTPTGPIASRCASCST
jgi:predicted ATPase